MSIVLRRTYLKVKNNVLPSGNGSGTPLSSFLLPFISRSFTEDKSDNPEFINSTILIENGLNVQELPVVVRKLKDLSEISQKPNVVDPKTAQDSVNYQLILTEFNECIDLRDVFSLLSKCTKITPNIALGAMERIYDLEKNTNSNPMVPDYSTHVNMAKGAIVDKLLKVVTKTEDTQTILNILNTVSSFMDPYKHKFCDELLLRVVDNKLSIEQLCTFENFLIKNRNDPRYGETIDKLWVGFVERENEIHEKNVVEVFKILPGLKVSKRIVLSLLEQKLFDLWSKISVPAMQDILATFVDEKYSSLQSFAVIGTWLNTNIHALNEESLLDIVTKLTRLNYTDDQVEKAVEKYMKFKGSKIESYILIVGILNFCMQFKIRNEIIFYVCGDYILKKGCTVPPSFLKSLIFPFGYLYYKHGSSKEFCSFAENVLCENFEKISAEDIASTILSLIYIESYPLKLVSKVFSAEYLVKIKNTNARRKLHAIDTALSLECDAYTGPLLPKDQWSKPVTQDKRIKNIVEKIKEVFVAEAGGTDKLSTSVLIPYMYSDTYLIDAMIHPTGLGSNTFNWKLKSGKNENIAILVHLPDHYCSDNDQLIGPQIMRKKHLRLLGMKVTSLKYSILSQYYTSYNNSSLREYIKNSIQNAEPCL